MANTMLGSADISLFLRSVASMMSVGMRTDEAVSVIADTGEDDALRQASSEVYGALLSGGSLSHAMRLSGRFPDQAIGLIEVGESTGHLDDALLSLADYYDEEARVIEKIRASVTYPCAILCAMSIVLAFTVAAILPVFSGVYDNMAGSLAASSFSVAQAGIVIGWVALVITLAVTAVAIAVFVASRTDGGRARLIRMLERLPLSKRAFYDLALSRFAAALAAYSSAGDNIDDAVDKALRTVDHSELSAKLTLAHGMMTEPVHASGLVQALSAVDVFDAYHMRMLSIGLRTGSVDQALADMSQGFFDDAVCRIDSLLDKIEPMLAGFVTVAVAVCLIAVMLPLIGMMGAIG